MNSIVVLFLLSVGCFLLLFLINEFYDKPKKLKKAKKALLEYVSNENIIIEGIEDSINNCNNLNQLNSVAKSIDSFTLKRERELYIESKLEQIRQITETDTFKQYYPNYEISIGDNILNDYHFEKTKDLLSSSYSKLLKQWLIISTYEETVSKENIKLILDGRYFVGMTEDMVIDSQRREPDKVEFEVLKTKTKKVFIYGNKSSGDVLTFENGVLVRFKDR